MDTNFRRWELTRAPGEGGKTKCNNGRCQTVAEDDVTVGEDQDDCGNEEFTSRGEGSTSAEEGRIGLVRAPARKGGVVGLQDR
jgi:hypothetical protein